MKKVSIAAMLLALAAARAGAQVNAGEQKPEASMPFTMTQVADFKLPWRIAFLPDGRMLITEKVGPVWLVTQKGEKTPIANVPAVLWQGQGGMLGIFLSPHYAADHNVYLTYSATARGLEPVMVYYGILDRVPRGRDEGDPADPTWVRRHDEFADAG